MTPRALGVIWTDRRVRASVFGYFGHMWELYAFWVATPLLVRAVLRPYGLDSAAWSSLGLDSVPISGDLAASTLSAVRYPAGIGPALIPAIQARGVTVASGLHPAIRESYFRVGHMGWVVTRPELLIRTAAAVAEGLRDCGARVDPSAAARAAEKAL